ncbi:hypothetical protein AC578_10837 [Pseudocercospora eumusae]|uniref:Phosphatidylglycerol/phosphatidylinositol transfer protein n=1 Tax=Pseudocercospora eumusae TaxID=321146 RepID=A0A139H8T6_9PEZI|nr:hypothetical protein AC578_10837 [Pseudocercospora eumusae]
MKFLSIATSALLATTVAARSTIADNEDPLSVPGENPLLHCEDPKDDVLALKSVDLTPNPPQAGTKLEVVASGVLADDVEDGAQVHLTVKYGLITIIRQTANLCDTVKNVDLECPIKKGDIKLTKDVDLPKEIPPGKYTVLADVRTKDDDRITCLTATVQFSRGGSMLGGLFKQEPKQDI